MSKGTVCFTVDAAWLADFARKTAWMEGDRDRAVRLLGHLAREDDPSSGLSGEAVAKILDGDATLMGDSSEGVEYVETPDPAWKAVVERRRDFYAVKAQEELDELRKAQDDVYEQAFTDELPRAQLTFEKNQDLVKRRYGGHYTIGGRKVAKALVDQYATVVRRIRRGAFLGVSSEIANDPLAFFQLEERRVALHDEMMAALGLARDSEQGSGFTLALHDWLSRKIGDMGEKE